MQQSALQQKTSNSQIQWSQQSQQQHHHHQQNQIQQQSSSITQEYYSNSQYQSYNQNNDAYYRQQQQQQQQQQHQQHYGQYTNTYPTHQQQQQQQHYYSTSQQQQLNQNQTYSIQPNNNSNNNQIRPQAMTNQTNKIMPAYNNSLSQRRTATAPYPTQAQIMQQKRQSQAQPVPTLPPPSQQQQQHQWQQYYAQQQQQQQMIPRPQMQSNNIRPYQHPSVMSQQQQQQQQQQNQMINQLNTRLPMPKSMSPLPQPTAASTPNPHNNGYFQVQNESYQQTPPLTPAAHSYSSSHDQKFTHHNPQVSTQNSDAYNYNQQARRLSSNEPKLCFPVRDGTILEPFKLEPNLITSNLTFYLKPHVFQSLMIKEDLELHLKAYRELDQFTQSNWPLGLSITVNNQLLNIDDKTHKPLNIKSIIQHGMNTLQITVSQWVYSHKFILYIVHRPSIQLVMSDVIKKQLVIKERCIQNVKMHFQSSSSNQSNLNDDTIIQTSVTISLKDSHNKRLSVPARGIDCKHLNCFDLYSYLEANSDKNIWTCPICQKFTRIDMLQVDQYLWSICNELRGDIDEIIFDASGSYKPKLKNINKMVDPLSPAEIQTIQHQTQNIKQIKSPYQAPIPTPTHQSWQMSQPSPYNTHIASPFSPNLLDHQQQYAPNTTNTVPISNPSTPAMQSNDTNQLNNVDFQNPPSIGRPQSRNPITTNNNLTTSLPTPPTSSGSSNSNGGSSSSYTMPNTPLQSTNHSQMPPTPQSHSTQSQPSTPATPGASTTTNKLNNQNLNQCTNQINNDLNKRDDDITVKQDHDTSCLHDLSDLNIDPADFLASDNVPLYDLATDLDNDELLAYLGPIENQKTQTGSNENIGLISKEASDELIGILAGTS